MKKAKDIFWLLFWGIIAGAVFVGCILGFGSFVNWLNTAQNAPMSAMGFKISLLVVICVVLFVLFKVALVFNNKITHKQAAKVFPPELLDFIYNLWLGPWCSSEKTSSTACAFCRQTPAFKLSMPPCTTA